MTIEREIIVADVHRALTEDVGAGDITSELLDPDQHMQAEIICREQAILCGIPWAVEVYQQLDERVFLEWLVLDGDAVHADQTICRMQGPVRSLLTGERCALNFLQTLSGTATLAAQYQQRLANNQTAILDTRKTIPGLRYAQKYAVRCGGSTNHRMGLYDAFLIKENHIQACGSITAAIKRARELHPEKLLEVEIETLQHLEEALAAKPDRIMLDNFELPAIVEAVAIAAGRIPLEASGNIGLENITDIADTGVDYISIGAITKHVVAADLSMRLIG